MRARSLLLALLVGCAGEAPRDPGAGTSAATTPAPADGVDDGLHVGRRGLYKLRATLEPDPPPMSRLFAVQVELLDATTGAPVPDAKVAVDAKMPQHGHGMSTQPVNEPAEGCAEGAACLHPGGLYRTTGMKFHMPGAWTVEVDIEGPKGVDRVVFTYEMPA